MRHMKYTLRSLCICNVYLQLSWPVDYLGSVKQRSHTSDGNNRVHILCSYRLVCARVHE